ncbi:hypothetical protein VZH09_10300 [Synechococcus elongatus IITB7]|uniref:hypothetical protein n=1 Tax=Synechococcus elongatus TaxID=32046 RepID=UPI0030D31C1C
MATLAPPQQLIFRTLNADSSQAELVDLVTARIQSLVLSLPYEWAFLTVEEQGELHAVARSLVDFNGVNLLAQARSQHPTLVDSLQSLVNLIEDLHDPSPAHQLARDRIRQPIREEDWETWAPSATAQINEAQLQQRLAKYAQSF